jgi:hypothetical protein
LQGSGAFLNIDYAVMGGAAVCLLANDPTRITEDVDLVIHVDHRGVTADRLTSLLIDNFQSDFAPVLQFRHGIPGYKLSLPGGDVRLVDAEVFDYQSWPRQPQYNIPSSTRRSMIVNGQTVKTLSHEWIFREKTLSQHQREGSPKGLIDIRDINRMIPMLNPGKPELDFDRDIRLESALPNLLQKRPLLGARLKDLVKSNMVFS